MEMTEITKYDGNLQSKNFIEKLRMSIFSKTFFLA